MCRGFKSPSDHHNQEGPRQRGPFHARRLPRGIWPNSSLAQSGLSVGGCVPNAATPRAFSLQVSQLHDAVFVEGIAGRAVFGMSYAAGVREGDVGGRVVSQGSRRERVPDALHMGVPAENE